jgi:hypothetical protein
LTISGSSLKAGDRVDRQRKEGDQRRDQDAGDYVVTEPDDQHGRDGDDRDRLRCDDQGIDRATKCFRVGKQDTQDDRDHDRQGETQEHFDQGDAQV